MDASVTAAVGDVSLEGSLLLGVQNVAGGGEEDHSLIVGQVLVGELGGVLRGVDLEVVLLAEGLDGRNAVGDGVVAEAGRLGEDEDLIVRGGLRLSFPASEQPQRRAQRRQRNDHEKHAPDPEQATPAKNHRSPPYRVPNPLLPSLAPPQSFSYDPTRSRKRRSHGTSGARGAPSQGPSSFTLLPPCPFLPPT
jgi:hypothetical protein